MIPSAPAGDAVARPNVDDTESGAVAVAESVAAASVVKDARAARVAVAAVAIAAGRVPVAADSVAAGVLPAPDSDETVAGFVVVPAVAARAPAVGPVRAAALAACVLAGSAAGFDPAVVADSVPFAAPVAGSAVAADVPVADFAAASAPAAVVDSVLFGAPAARALAAGSVVVVPVADFAAHVVVAAVGSARVGAPVARVLVVAAEVRAWRAAPAWLAFQASLVSRPADPVVRRPEHRLQGVRTRWLP